MNPLFDEHSDHDFRDEFGRLCRAAERLDVAVTRIRLSTLDLTRGEVDHLKGIRLLLAEVNTVTLDVEAHAVLAGGTRGRALRRLAHLLVRGVVEVRTAPLGGWSPDFSVFHDAKGPISVLVGFHWLERPFPFAGPALASLHGREGGRLASARFDRLWDRAHDISPAVMAVLERARRHAGDPTRSGAPPDEKSPLHGTAMLPDR